ncbi:MAG: Acetyl-CoA decarbonylase/synthase complex subunit gamma 1 [Methanosaeta sp. PtaB.Bin039]|nr:MAG: Acetyl-CoA decarbonylase/synthase complex subunit gamma 1 [Methanosaeta sp. PtaB.Bin039]HOT08021.1 acetyl-CoA decarbonylase/synthase complex subunit gamma [Methanotrichaceae archaeon]HQF17447.1 acetyl-CoA decarbonylase/synthase complex subunit gamma [Methanotrichaceae archaeon]HQI92059.1 acetyl-CoA decarbonylase/synthase complex subunit gamma [Methanotrichaceae archaeon]HQJ29442.1 acetyl-CoA decarbonylase/synthase complex subunit gamma [Methanotrichaceae archaeon]
MKEKSPLNLYKQLPQTNCGKCGEQTCMAFAAGLIARTRKVEECTPLVDEKKYAKKLDALKTIVAPEIRLVYVGTGEKQFKVGGEDVMYRHLMTFFNKPPFAYDVADNMDEAKLVERVKKISTWRKFYIGKWERIEMIAVRSVTGDPAKFASCVKKVQETTDYPLILCSFDPKVLKAGLEVAAKSRPLVYAANKDNWQEVAKLVHEFNVPVVLSAPFDLDALKSMATTFESMGISDLVLDIGTAPNGKKLQESLQNLLKLRRAALEEGQRDIAYPIIALPINAWFTTTDPVRAAYWESVLTATFVIRGAAILVKHSIEPHSVMPDMHLRFNIYTDPRTPVQVKPGLHTVGTVSKESPTFVTTNFALTYYTVESDIGSNNIAARIMSIGTDGIGVQASVAGGQLTPQKIVDSFKEAGFDFASEMAYPSIVLPGMAAKFSGELEDLFGGKVKVLVGPEDSGRIAGWMEQNWPPKK